MGNDREPWWSADDEEYSGATPIFSDGPDATDATEAADSADSADHKSAGDEDPRPRRTENPRPDWPPTGSAITEALRLAAALSSWSQQTGLTDQLKGLAGEAGAVLAARAAAAGLGNLSGGGAGGVDSDEGEDDTADFALEGGSTCEVCPLCRGVDLLRAVQPQLADGVTEAMASISFALESALATMDTDRD